jgi:hypothetical protein
MIGRTLVATLALLLLGALIGASGSSAAQIKYRGKMVEKPPAGAKAREPVSFTVVKVRRNQKTRRKRPGRAKRIKDFSLERPAGTTCVVSNDVSFPFDLLALGFPQIERNGPHRVKRDGTFRFRETGRIPVSDLAGLRDVDGNDFLAWQRGVVGRLRRDGTATGKVRLRFTDPAGTTVCDSYGKRAWVAHEVKR